MNYYAYMVRRTNVTNVFDRTARKALLEYDGIVVESVNRTYDGKEVWSMVLFNKSTDSFNRAESVNIVPMFIVKEGKSQKNPGWDNSALSKRFRWWDDMAVEANSPEDYEGYVMHFTTIISESSFGTSVRAKPTKKLGRIGGDELAALKDKLKGLRDSANAKRANDIVDATPAASLSFTDEEVSELVSIFNGKSEEEAQNRAFRSTVLGDMAKNAVFTGAAGATLLGNGKLTLDEEGKYKAVE